MIGIGLVSNGSRGFRAVRQPPRAAGRRGHRLARLRPHRRRHLAIFLAALEHLGTAPEAAAMVGDSLEDDVEGARALGMLGSQS